MLRRVPAGPVAEEDAMNVTLHCDLVGENHLELAKVSWFMNGQLIRQLPDPHCDNLGYHEKEFTSGESEYELGFVFYDMGSGMETDTGVDINLSYLCDVDPTTLMLKHVTRDFSGNFSCSGSNIAGEGPASENVSLNVLCK